MSSIELSRLSLSSDLLAKCLNCLIAFTIGSVTKSNFLVSGEVFGSDNDARLKISIVELVELDDCKITQSDNLTSILRFFCPLEQLE